MKRTVKFFIMIAWAVTLLLWTVACGSPVQPTQEPRAPDAAPVTNLSSWDALVKAGQKEGTLTIYATAIAPITATLRSVFKQRFDIDLEFIQGRPAEITARIAAERRAGIFQADVGHLGETTAARDIKPQGWSTPLPDLLVLPDVKNPDNWKGKRLPYVDKGNHVLMFVAKAVPFVVANTDMVKEGELVSFLDLLKPQWKGRIVLSDPTISGTSPNLLAALYQTFGDEKARDIFRKLAAQQPVINRDQRLMLEWLARGRYPVGLGQSGSLFSEFRRAGAPVQFVDLKEPRFISAGPGNIVVFNNNPHPRATQVYINWLMTAEGTSLWSKGLEVLPLRSDVSGEELNPAFVTRPDDIFPDEDHLELRVQMRDIAREIFGPLVR
ncbi:MAG: extracellular solute-binding protein [Chloroflexi bacterium]|nr:extracellular solute-binding protein [Chloroflexota bacterium]